MRSVRCVSRFSRTALSTLLLTLFSLGSPLAFAVQEAVQEYYCADDISNVGSCAANEISLGGVINVSVTDINGNAINSCVDGQLIKLDTLSAQLDSNTGTRYDIAFWVGRKGNDPRVPNQGADACGVVGLPEGVDPVFVNNFEGGFPPDGDDDNCLDFTQPTDPLPLTFGGGGGTMLCSDSTNDGFADLQVLTTWVQNTGFRCGEGTPPPYDNTDPDFVPIFSPGSPSKCDFTIIELIPIVEPASLTIQKQSQGGTGVFDFTTTGLSSTAIGDTFQLDTTVTNPASISDPLIVISDIEGGDTFTINEDDPTPFILASATCDNGDDPTTGVTLLPGDVVTCTFTNVQQGAVTIVKNTVGGEGNFGFTGTNGIPDFSIMTVGGTGSVSTTDLGVGVYTVTETPQSGWDLTDLVCDDPNGGTTVDLENGVATIGLSDGENVTCTYENTQRGQIGILKTTSPSGTDPFEFTHDVVGDTVPASPFDLNAGSSQDFLDVVPGSYVITETDPTPAYDLDNILCIDSDDQGVDSVIDVANRTVTINLEPGEQVGCEFTNFKRGSLTVVKSVSADGPLVDDFDFTSIALGDFSLLDVTFGNDALTTFAELVSGDYDIAEVDPTANGWQLVSATCDDGTDLLDPNAPIPGSVFVDVGQEVSCTFVNSPLGSSTIIKNTVGGDDFFDFTGTAQNGANNPMDGLQLETIAGSATMDFSYQLDPIGNPFTVTEAPIPPGWALSNIECVEDGTQDSTVDIGAATADINVDLAEAVTCTFTNTADASLVVQKSTIPGELGPFDFETDGVVLWDTAGATTASLSDGDQDSQTGQPGLYMATETVPAGFAITNIVCTGETLSTIQIGLDTPAFEPGDDFVEVTLVAGEVVTCAFENTKMGSITIIKETVGGDGSFVFSSPELDQFQLDTVDNLAETTFSDLLPGDYMIGEIVPTGWDLVDIACVGESTSTYDIANPAVTVSLMDGDDIACKFINVERGTITLVKNLPNDNGGDAVETDFTAFIEDNPVPWGVAQEFVPGSYLASESTLPGYLASDWFNACAADGSVVLGPGENLICEVTNDDIAPILTLVKTVTNDNGGLLTQTDFPSFVNAVSQAWDAATEVEANLLLTATETPQTGYTPSDWGGDCATDGTITLLPGDVKTCTITNDDVAPTLTLVKTVTNDNGGLLTQTDFPSFVDATPQAWDVATAQAANIVLTASETPQTGYAPSAWGGDCATDGTITLLPGDVKTCTITNDDVAPTLTLVKTVINDNGGELTQTDFPSFVNGVPQAWDVTTVFQANLPLIASETSQIGYTPSSWGGDCAADGTITLLPGDAKICSITNDDAGATLTLVKTVTNDDGGLLTQTDFPSFVDGVPQAWGLAQAVTTNEQHTASETPQTGYTPGVWGGDCAADGTVTLLPGETKTCTITNDDVAPTLTLVKTVTNDDGGLLTQTDFPSFVNGVPQAWDVATAVEANLELTATETPQTGYTPSVWGGDCAADGTITLLPGDVKTCSITNDDVAPLLTLIKDPTNDDSGTALPDDFEPTVGGVVVVSGESNPYDANVAYAIDETLLDGYSFVSIDGDDKCPAELGGTVTLDVGDDITCTITNDDDLSLINLAKSSRPAVNVGGNTWEVVYTITATNAGEGPGVYDIIDTMMPGDGITPDISALYPELVYVGGETQTGVLATPPLANGGTWVTLEGLAGMASESWTVTARFTVDEQSLVGNPGAADCVLEDGEQGTGYFNYVAGSETDEDLSDNETCVPHLLPSTPVPTLSTWAMLLMILLMTGVAGWYFRPVQTRRFS